MRLATVLLASITTVTLAAGAIGLSAPAAAAACSDYAFMGARGSGEPPEAEEPDNYGLGAPLSAVYSELVSITGRTGRTISAQGVDYPAVSIQGTDSINAIGKLLHITKTFDNSVAAGGQSTVESIRQLKQQCPNTLVILAGYSQGAMAIQAGMKLANSSDLTNVIGAFFFGDPQFNSASAEDTGTYDVNHSGVFGKHDDWSTVGVQNAISECHYADPICNSVATMRIGNVEIQYRDIPFLINAAKESGKDFFSPHLTYGDEARRAAAAIANEVGMPGVNPFETLPSADVGYFVNVADVADDLPLAKEQLSESIDTILASNPNACFSRNLLLGTKNSPYDQQYYGLPPISDGVKSEGETCTANPFDNEYDNWLDPGYGAPYGWALPSSTARLSQEMMSYIQGHPATARPMTLVLLSEQELESTHQTSEEYGEVPSRDELVAAAKEHHVTIVSGTLSNKPAETQSARLATTLDPYNEDFARQTGGDFAEGASALGELTSKGVRGGQTAIGLPGAVEVGQEFTATASSDVAYAPGTTFEWSVDGSALRDDGQTVKAQLSSGGDHTVSVTVRRPDSFASVSNARITVTAASNGTSPNTPDVAVVASRHEVTATWAKVAGAIGYQVVSSEGDVLDSFASDISAEEISWTMSGIEYGESVSFGVRSFNHSGSSSVSSVSAGPAEPDSAIISRSDLETGDRAALRRNADVLVDGKFVCGSNGQYSGDIIASGDVIIMPGCRIQGDVIAGGNIDVSYDTSIQGVIRANGDVKLHESVRVRSGVYAAGTAWSVDDYGNSSPLTGNSIHVHSPSVTLPAIPAQTPRAVPTNAEPWLQAFGTCNVSTNEVQQKLSDESDHVYDATACDSLNLHDLSTAIGGHITLFVKNATLSNLTFERTTDSSLLDIVSVDGGDLDLAWMDSEVPLSIDATTISHLEGVSGSVSVIANTFPSGATYYLY